MEPTLVAPPAPPASLGKTVFTRRNFLCLAAGSAAMAFYAGEISRHEIDIVYRTITLPRLPDPFAGFKIVQISDFHFQEYTEATFLEAVVRRVNEVAPDLVVLTGDFVSSGPLPRHFSVRMGYHCAEILSRIHCPLRYAILGNHDFLVGAHAVTDALLSHGIPVLANSSVALERDGRRLWLAGTQDALEGWPNLTAIDPAGRNAEPLILLAHEPDFADHAVGRQIDLMLSGHTHGGQVRLPFLPPLLLPKMGTRYVEGHFQLRDGMQLYVNRGIGAVNLPFRFRCPPEISVLTLQPGA